LNALKAFEAAARNLSFTIARNELGGPMAQSAARVQTLEHWLDLKLFRRFNRRLEPRSFRNLQRFEIGAASAAGIKWGGGLVVIYTDW
jgi:hypothetical protein